MTASPVTCCNISPDCLLTCVQVAVDALLRNAVKSSDVIVAVPDPQLLSSRQRPADSEVDVFTVLKRREVPVALLR